MQIFMQYKKQIFQNHFYNKIAMLMPNQKQKIQQIMAFQKVISDQQEPNFILNDQLYQDLMVFVFEVNPLIWNSSEFLYFNSLFSLFQYCDSFNFSLETSYLAKIYVDIVLKKSTDFDVNQLSILSLCCIWMAIKFNQPIQVSHQFSTNVICQQGGNNFSVNQLLALQNYVLRLLQYRLKYSTPYHYIQPFLEIFPQVNKTKATLKPFVELSGLILKLINNSAYDIFYGFFFSLLQLKKCILQPSKKNILSSLIKDVDKIEAISKLILQKYNQLSQPEQQMGDQKIQSHIQ